MSDEEKKLLDELLSIVAPILRQPLYYDDGGERVCIWCNMSVRSHLPQSNRNRFPHNVNCPARLINRRRLLKRVGG